MRRLQLVNLKKIANITNIRIITLANCIGFCGMEVDFHINN
jgi:hypothetical protein